MTVVPSLSVLDESLSAVKLARYAAIVGLHECNLFGVNFGDSSQCEPLWSLQQRAMLLRYLIEAQSEIEQVAGFFLMPKYVIGEQHPYRYPLVSKWMKVIAMGVKAISNISLGKTVDYTNDPCEITVTTAVTNDEIRIYHAGTDIEITPSSMVNVAGTLTIEVPRCRMVEIAAQDTPQGGLDYNDVPPSGSSPFVFTVDVKRVYTDTTDTGDLVYPHSKSDGLSCSCQVTCSEFLHEACAYLKVPKTGVIDVLKTNNGIPSNACGCFSRRASYARINYLSGMDPLTSQAEDTIIRLAHSKMALKPCGCDIANSVWERDRHIPDQLDSQRLGNPFGVSDGAWVAWKFANALKIWRAGVL